MYNYLIISHNRLEHLKAKVSQLLERTQQPSTIYVIDRGSSDGSIEYLKSEFMNQCLEHIPHIHPDVYINENSVKSCIEFGRDLMGFVNEIHFTTEDHDEI